MLQSADPCLADAWQGGAWDSVARSDCHLPALAPLGIVIKELVLSASALRWGEAVAVPPLFGFALPLV